MEFIKKLNIDFIGRRRPAFIISGILILVGSSSLVLKGGPRYGIDFTGGTLLQAHLSEIRGVGDIRRALLTIPLTAEIQNFGEPQEFLIRYGKDIDASEVKSVIEKELNVEVRLDRTEMVGPRIGAELKQQALLAILLGLFLMLIYITVRFDLKFGAGTVIALFHDVLITLGVFSLLNKEITIGVVAAILTIVGYSINDSIVVSDRIRENLKKLGKKVPLPKFIEYINRSINEVLSRTIITSLTTLLVLVAILMFGGPVIFDFAFALFIGVIVGTYSSVYVVASLVTEWEVFRSRKSG